MRTLTLADELRLKGAEIIFITREHVGNMIDHLTEKNYPVLILEDGDGKEYQATGSHLGNEEEGWLGKTWQEDCLETREKIEGWFSAKDHIDWLIVDHYALDSRWESTIGEIIDKVMVIDDLANRDHDSDIVLDQNLFENMVDRYRGLVPDKCQLLLGPEFALVRPEFLAARGSLRKRNGNINRILLFYGGSDPTNETMKALEGLEGLSGSVLLVDVVVGNANQRNESIREYCIGKPNINYHYNIDYMAMLMADADLFVGSGGTSTWERCCLGLPSVVIAIAKNQENISLNAHQHGIGIYLGTSDMVDVDHIVAEVARLRKRPDLVKEMSGRCIKMVDGRGASKVANQMKRIAGA